MKRIAVLLTMVLGGAILHAQEKPQMTEMTGTICDSKCVTQNASLAACDLNCKQHTGEAVFIEDDGKVTKITNPEKVKGYMGKRVKAKCKKEKDKDEMTIYGIYG